MDNARHVGVGELDHAAVAKLGDGHAGILQEHETMKIMKGMKEPWG
jgi:hypothetical protein